MDLNEMIERQCDSIAAGTAMRDLLRRKDIRPAELRELLRLYLEQFAGSLRQALSEAIRTDTVYVQWIGNQSLPVSDPFVTVFELNAALDRVFGHDETTSPSTTSST